LNACRNALSSLLNTPDFKAHHPGLVLQRYLTEHDSQSNNKRDLLGRTITALGRNHQFYKLAFQRYKENLEQIAPCKSVELEINGRMAVGLSTPSPIELGLTFHHTYGTPILPGSALKGLAAHYSHQIWGGFDQEYAYGGAYHRTIFGTNDEAGHISFHDGMILPESIFTANSQQGPLSFDVVTVHHQEYYSGSTQPPSDEDSPVPNMFLTIQGRFYIALSGDVPGEQGHRWTERTMELLVEALQNWGFGAKTAAGYGRFTTDKVVVQKNILPGKK
jgi:CRISPR-associated protein Cmr6